MKYLKVDTDFTENMESLGDAERGRLFTAMLDYAKDGTAADLRGSERILWGTVKKAIDEQRKAYEGICERNLRNATSRYQRLPVATSRTQSQQHKDIYISTPSREPKDLDSVDIREDSLSRDSSRDSTTPLLEKDKAKEPTRSRKPSNTTVLDGFDTFWLIYPNKKAKKDARKAWEKIKPNEELQQTIIAAVNEQKQSKQWIEGYVPYPATWLNGERWNDVTKPMDRLAHLRDLYEQEVANDNTGYGADVRGDSDPVSTGNGFFDFLKSDGR